MPPLGRENETNMVHEALGIQVILSHILQWVSTSVPPCKERKGDTIAWMWVCREWCRVGHQLHKGECAKVTLAGGLVLCAQHQGIATQMWQLACSQFDQGISESLLWLPSSVVTAEAKHTLLKTAHLPFQWVELGSQCGLCILPSYRQKWRRAFNQRRRRVKVQQSVLRQDPDGVLVPLESVNLV